MVCNSSAALAGAQAAEGVIRLIGDIRRGVLHLDDVRQVAASVLERYGHYLNECLTDAGIIIPPAVDLTTGETGAIQVLSHPQAATILAVFQQNERLIRGFKEVEILHEIVRAKETGEGGGRDVDELATMMRGRAPFFNLGLTSAGPIVFFSRPLL